MGNGNEVITGDLPSGFRDDHLRLQLVELSPEFFVLEGDFAIDWFETFCNLKYIKKRVVCWEDLVQVPSSNTFQKVYTSHFLIFDIQTWRFSILVRSFTNLDCIFYFLFINRYTIDRKISKYYIESCTHRYYTE